MVELDVSVCLIHGARLPDPAGIMEGGGKQTRFVRLKSAKSLQRPAVEALLAAANAAAEIPFPDAGGGKLVIRSVSAKQRPRRYA